jgi:hypothetical protein
MSIVANFKRYWPWWVALVWLGAYELYALFVADVDIATAPEPQPGMTLSRLAWYAQRNWGGIAYLTTGIVVVLLVHFWLKNRVKPEA